MSTAGIEWITKRGTKYAHTPKNTMNIVTPQRVAPAAVQVQFFMSVILKKLPCPSMP
jgi:hypothetical protein